MSGRTVCQRCRCRPPARGKSRCEDCGKKDAAYVKARRDSGLCLCGSPAAAGRRSCAACLAAMAANRRKKYARMKAAGRCPWSSGCRSEPLPGHVYCPEHLREFVRLTTALRARRLDPVTADPFRPPGEHGRNVPER